MFTQNFISSLRFTECCSLDGSRTGQGDCAAAGGLVTFTASDGAQFGGEGGFGDFLEHPVCEGYSSARSRVCVALKWRTPSCLLFHLSGTVFLGGPFLFQARRLVELFLTTI